MKTLILVFLLSITSFAQVSRIIPMIKDPTPAGGGGSTERVAGDSILFIYSDLTDGTVTTGEWECQISGRTFTVTGTPSKGSTGVTVDGSDGFYNTEPTYSLPSALFIEAVVYIPDTSAIGATAFLAGVNDGSHSFNMVFRSNKLVISYDGGERRTYDTTPFHNSVVHVIAARNGTNDSLWVNGSPVSESGTTSSGASGDNSWIIFGQYDSGGDGLPNNSRLYFLAVNPKFPTDAEAEQNYDWWAEQ